MVNNSSILKWEMVCIQGKNWYIRQVDIKSVKVYKLKITFNLKVKSILSW
jgi:hypothetical protein